jgi:hypothetical protein
MRCLTEPAPKFAFYDPKKLATKPSFPFRPTSFVLDPTKVRRLVALSYPCTAKCCSLTVFLAAAI